MIPNEDQNFDAVMREWAAKHAASPEKLDELTSKVLARVEESRTARAVKSRRVLVRGRLAWLGIGSAVAASVAVFFYVARSTHGPFEPPGVSNVQPSMGDLASVPAAAAGLTAHELEQKAILARELQLLFPRRFAWIMETGHETELGLTLTDSETRPGRVIAVRFVVEARPRGQQKWQPVETLDLLTRAEEVVQLALSKSGSGVFLWTYATPDGMISVDAELNLPAPVPICISSSRLQPAGSSSEIWQSELGGIEYRVRQIAELLDQHMLG